MDSRVQERRRVVNRERGRRRAGLIFLCVLAFAVLAAFLWLRSSTVFAVQQVSAPVTHHVTQEQIADAVSVARGASLLKLSTRAIEKKLATLPYIRSVHVYRQFPNTLEIKLQEYEAVARVRTADGRVWLTGDDGRLLERAGSQGPSALPLIIPAAGFVAQAGAMLPQGVVSALPVALMLQTPEVAANLPEVADVTVSAGGEVVVHLRQGTELRLGAPKDLKQKMTVAVGIVEEYLRDGKTLEYVDASAADRVAVKAE
jgi:cell division protein FtsQ